MQQKLKKQKYRHGIKEKRQKDEMNVKLKVKGDDGCEVDSLEKQLTQPHSANAALELATASHDLTIFISTFTESQDRWM